jgi:hypothetical protein
LSGVVIGGIRDAFRVSPARALFGTVRTAPARVRQVVIVIRREHVRAEQKLFDVIKVVRKQRAVFGFGKSWKEKARENGDDGNNDEKFNERESLMPVRRSGYGEHKPRIAPRF